MHIKTILSSFITFAFFSGAIIASEQHCFPNYKESYVQIINAEIEKISDYIVACEYKIDALIDAKDPKYLLEELYDQQKKHYQNLADDNEQIMKYHCDIFEQILRHKDEDACSCSEVAMQKIGQQIAEIWLKKLKIYDNYATQLIHELPEKKSIIREFCEKEYKKIVSFYIKTSIVVHALHDASNEFEK